MPTHVRFVLNKLTGEVEEFLVDDQNRALSEAEHDRRALEVGRVIARNPGISEAAAPPPPAAPPRRPEGDRARDAERSGQTETARQAAGRGGG